MTQPKLKVLIIPSWYPTKKNFVTGSFFQEQAALIADNADVKVLYGKQRDICLFEFYKKRIKYKIKVQTYNCERIYADAIEPPECIAFYCDRVVGLSEKKNYYFMLFQYEIMLKELIAQGWKPDVIHAHSTDEGGIVAYKLAEMYSLPTVITEHQVFLLHQKTEFKRKKIMEALEGVTQVAAVSNHQMRCILMHNIVCNPIITGNFIDENLFGLISKSKSDKIFKIISVTYPSYIKDVETFFKSIEEVIRRGHCDVQVTVIGNNSFDDLNNANIEIYRSLASRHNIDAYCVFVPFVKRSELSAFYHESDVFVSTSIAETFGVAVREAMATGLPVISTANGGIDDTIDDSNGIKVNIRDVSAIAEAIIKIKTKQIDFDPAKIREKIVNSYGRNAFSNILLNLYKDTIKNFNDDKGKRND